MPRVDGAELLRGAEAGGYAVPGFNVSNLELALGVLDAAEARRAPIFLQFNRSNLEHIGGLELAATVARALAERAPIAVAVHLDHGNDIPLLQAAASYGFTSLMYDGSTLPLERNILETQRAYVVAAAAGVSLEAELGHVGGREPGVATSEAIPTEPDAARRFVEETRVNSLAVSVGTAHGLAGTVDLTLVRELRAATRGLPLVLHGGSGVSPRNLQDAVRAGIRKVNISTEIHAAFARALTEASPPDPRPALRAARAAVAEVAAQRLDLLGAAQQS